jgi:sugar diacid utilization regulator
MGAQPLPERAGAAPAPLIESLRHLHLEMVDAVLCGEGVERVAELASRAAGGAVAIVLPRLGAAAVWPPEEPEAGERLRAIQRYVEDRVRDRPSEVPAEVVREVPIVSGDETLGAVLMLPDARPAHQHAGEFLHLAAVASLTEVAIAEAKDEVEHNLRGSLLEDLRAQPDLGVDDVLRRAMRLGSDLSLGAVALCAQLSVERPRHVLATVTGEHPGALAQHLDGRVYALLPATEGSDPEDTLAVARTLAGRLRRYGTVGTSSFYADAGDFGRAIQEAELVLEVLGDSDAGVAEEIGHGTYRLLFRVLASHPEEIRDFYEGTVAPVVAYDNQYGTDLVGTLDAYLERNCNMNATASAIYAHRHTVAYRLERVRELTGLDPMLSEDRERLGLGLKAYRIIAPRLPR